MKLLVVIPAFNEEGIVEEKMNGKPRIIFSRNLLYDVVMSADYVWHKHATNYKGLKRMKKYTVV